MKNVLLIIIVLMSTELVSAQLFSKERLVNNENFDKPQLSYGYYLGFNVYDYNIDYTTNVNDVQVLKYAGLNVGLVGNFRINDYIDIRLEPGLVISRRELNYSYTYFNGISHEEKDLIREIQSTFVHIPLLMKFSTKRINNIKPFIVAGFSTALNLSSQQNNPKDNSNNTFRVTKNNLYYELGIGIDLYLTWFKFTPSLRGVFSIQDELVNDVDPNSPWTKNMTQIQTRGLFINFTFQ
ncbi:PorT family protein [Flavobacteriaceae bacterium]|nr:PorT family protein [Flavobacteriaceae bacterium]